MSIRRISALVVVLAGLACVPASPAVALNPPFKVTAAKHKDGPYHQSGNVNLAVGESQTLYWRVKSTSGGDLDMHFDDAATQDPNPPGFKVKWFKGHKNISSDVKNDPGYPFKLKAGKTKSFRATIKRTQPNSDQNVCLGGQGSEPTFPHADGAYFGVNGNCV